MLTLVSRDRGPGHGCVGRRDGLDSIQIQEGERRKVFELGLNLEGKGSEGGRSRDRRRLVVSRRIWWCVLLGSKDGLSSL